MWLSFLYLFVTCKLQVKSGTPWLDPDGPIFRTVYGDKPPVKVVYQLTELGKTTIPVLLAVNDWGKQLAKEKGEFIGDLQVAESSAPKGRKS